jgi:hypothetical protein
VAVAVGVNVAVAVGVKVAVAVAVGVGVKVAVAVGVGVSVAVAVAEGVGVNVAVAVGEGVGVEVAVVAITNCDWLGMPFVKTVTSAYPMGKPLEVAVIRAIGVEVNEVSDQPAVASTGRKSVCSLARLSSWTTG